MPALRRSVRQSKEIRSWCPSARRITDVGFLAVGSGVTATVGGDGTLANTMENYANGRFIVESNGSPNASVGNPNVTILGNTFLARGCRPTLPRQ